MRKLILIAHISLDGFVASPDGKVDGFDASEENLQFVCRLTEDADAAMFGRVTFRWLDGAWSGAASRKNATKGEIAFSNWYNSAKKIVFSRTITDDSPNNTVIIRDNVLDEVTKIKSQSGRNILVFGSPSVSQELMRLNLFDVCWIFVNPIFFGEGIPLFKELKDKWKLRPSTMQKFPNGEIAIRYDVEKR